MSGPRRSYVKSRGLTALAVAGLLTVVGAAFAATALATVDVSRAELSGTRLRIEGTALPNHPITVDGVAMGTSDGNGLFKVERDPFTPRADCNAFVDDGSGAIAVLLSGCTVSSAPAPASMSSLTVTPTQVTGGDPATGTVTLTSAAPTGGVVVALNSDDTAAATVPASVTVAAGATSATFPITTFSVANSQSSIITGTAGGVTKGTPITVLTPFAATHGSIDVIPGGNGSGHVTSQPAGIDCTIGGGDGTGTCSAFFAPGTFVKLDARPASGSSFQGWRGVGCGKGEVTVQADTNVTCQVGFALKF